ncbi:LPS export ABC transporter permease LptG [Sneathiella chinensis]|uniref:LPS export ABC transporter permease LptG n=1 Tax=Sneathiella chinensis TaxID=349750 RepID=A0ABQ5U629_9PROT|nr:LPS export ABC transporter permease LptG [Sneathiella chinensis]GLQ07567.1 LPS export ABC transporter permease LptG [Sneathiella chinensis]
MRLSGNLSLYLGRQFLKNVGLICGILVSIIFLVDFIELLRRAGDKENITIGLVVQMTLMRLPDLTQKLLPFMALFGGMLTFFRLSKTSELTIIRAAGVSVWQFLLPSLVIAFLTGAFVLTVFNPLAATMEAHFEQLEAKYLEQRSNLLQLSSKDLWLRQVDPDGLSVIHARGALNQGIDLTEVIIFKYDRDEQFTSRIEADRARLRDGYWDLTDVLMTSPDQPGTVLDTMRLDTSLTVNQIQESFASPKTISFWELPQFINTLEEAGFSAVRHRLYWHSLLAAPVLLAAMVLVAATFSLRAQRQGRTGLLVMAGIATGFVFYFFTDIVYALGMSGGLPVQLAAWTPAATIALFGLSMMFHLEDG